MKHQNDNSHEAPRQHFFLVEIFYRKKTLIFRQALLISQIGASLQMERVTRLGVVREIRLQQTRTKFLSQLVLYFQDVLRPGPKSTNVYGSLSIDFSGLHKKRDYQGGNEEALNSGTRDEASVSCHQ